MYTLWLRPSANSLYLPFINLNAFTGNDVT